MKTKLLKNLFYHKIIKNQNNINIGIIKKISSKNTIQITITKKKYIKKYNKYLIYKKNILIHSNNILIKKGNLIKYITTKPKSKHKHFMLLEIINDTKRNNSIHNR